MPLRLPYAGLLFVSDMDGTLITSQFEMPRRNIEAVRAFMAGGGRFAFATGRTRLSAGAFLDRVEVNAPCILDNGSLVYDYAAGRALWSAELAEDAAVPLLRGIIAAFAQFGAEVVTDQALYIVHENEATRHHTANETLRYDLRALAQVPSGGWRKLIFAGPHESIAPLETFVRARCGQLFDYVVSSTNFLEILPKGVSKGSTVLRLAQMLGIAPSRVFAIGDYFNDITLLQTAAYSGAPSGAPAQVRAAADVVVGSCEGGAVADFVELIAAREARA